MICLLKMKFTKLNFLRFNVVTLSSEFVFIWKVSCISLLLLYLLPNQFYGQSIPQLSEQASISVLTCAPGDELYSLFGHTAILVSDPENEIDYTFNYGTFDFSTPFFYLKFSQGNLDYLLSVTSFKNFLKEYFISGRSVWQQELNLSHEQKNELFKALIINARPENRAYRYDFFYDNCATRVGNIILEHIPGEVVFKNSPDSIKNITFREAIHPYLNRKPWIKLGIDLVLGAKADLLTDSVSIMFVPDHLMSQIAGLKFTDSSGRSQDLVKTQSLVLDFSDRKVIEPNSVSTSLFFWLFLFLLLLLSFGEVLGAINLKLFDFFLYLIIGITGLVVFYLVFVSFHIVTGSNWNLLWANPLWLIAVFLRNRKFTSVIRVILQCLLLLFFVSLLFTPQYIPNEFVAVSLLLFIRISPVINLILYKKVKR